MQLKRVDFPAPFGPMTLTISPSATEKSMSWFAASPPNHFETPFNSRQIFSLILFFTYAGNPLPYALGLVNGNDGNEKSVNQHIHAGPFMTERDTCDFSQGN